MTGWQIFRDNTLLTTLDNPATQSFDDTGVPSQGLHSYVVRATSGGVVGDASAPVSVVYDTAAPALATPTATPNPDGSVSLSWAPAVDPSPGAGVSGYVIRRGPSNTPPGGTTAGTDICTVTMTATGCVDTTAQSGSIYGYSLFALDGAGNLTRQTVTARALDTVGPDAGDRLPRLGRPDQRPPLLGCARAPGQERRSGRLPPDPPHARHEEADEPA